MTETAEPVQQSFSWKFLPKDSFLIPIGTIIVRPDRARKDFSYVPQLAESFKVVGMLQPIVVQAGVDAEVGKFILIAGETRLRASISVGATSIPAVLKEGMTELQLKTAELEENARRKDISWEERMNNVAQIDALKRKEYGDGGAGQPQGWNAKKTAELLGRSQTETNTMLQLSKTLKENPDLRKAVVDLPLTAALRKVKQVEQTKEATRRIESGIVQLHTDFKNGDALVLIKDLADGSQNAVICDPPFGLGTIDDDLGDTRGASQTYTALIKQTDNLSLEQANQLINQLAPELFRVLKDGSFIYMFCSMTVFPTWSQSLREAGFEISDQPIIWYKGRSTAKFSGYTHPSSYEPIIFGYKPPRTRQLRNPKLTNVITVNPISSAKKVHPFEKPAALIAQLIENATEKGEEVLDPFGGSGKTLAVCKSIERSGTSFELDKENWVRATVQLEVMGFEGGKDEMMKNIVAKK